MVLIPVYNILYFRLQVSVPQTPTHEKRVDGHASSICFIFIMLVVAQLLSGCGFGTQYVQLAKLVKPTGVKIIIGHCLDTLSNYGPGREPCTDRVFSPGPSPGVLSGFVFYVVHRGTIPLASPGILRWFPEGWHISLQLVYNWSTS
jgi:hypothetical protein